VREVDYSERQRKEKQLALIHDPLNPTDLHSPQADARVVAHRCATIDPDCDQGLMTALYD
jgi:hypothetical protein